MEDRAYQSAGMQTVLVTAPDGTQSIKSVYYLDGKESTAEEVRRAQQDNLERTLVQIAKDEAEMAAARAESAEPKTESKEEI